MKLIKINQPQVNESKEVPGLLNCRIEFEIKAAQGELHYSGPKFSAEMWHSVMSFFRWTHHEMQSESQVRLYVNHQVGLWGAWAFPQAARTGMSARELPTPETPEKARERFAHWNSEPSDDWLYFGTAHHHCSAGAFQSSTDEQNERNQDGLHLTVGSMDRERHDLHARFYLGGHGFEPDLSRFWAIPEALAAMVPSAMQHELARFQMGEKITVDFPAAWKANIIAAPAEPEARSERPEWGFDHLELEMPFHLRVDEALEEIHRRCAARAIAEQQWLKELHTLSANPIGEVIIESCVKHGITPEELLAEMVQYQSDGGDGLHYP